MWKELQEKSLELEEDNLELYKKKKETEIKSKEEIIAEIQKGIDSLKELSQETERKEK